MAITAANIIIGGVPKEEVPRDTAPTQSWIEMRTRVEQRPPVKNRNVHEPLIQYRDSAFLSDMLQSNED